MAKYMGTYHNAAMTSDAHFRQWGSDLHAAFLGAGLTQTADTGQIDWVTVTRPTGANTTAGSEMWRFNDSLQATAPIFIKVDFRSGSNSSGNNVGVQIQVGTGSDGALSLTGLTSNVLGAHNMSSTAFSGTYNRVWACYKEGSFNILADGMATTAAGNHSCTFGVSRSIDMTTGAYNADGCYITVPAAVNSSSVYLYSQAMNFSTSTLGATTTANAAPPGDLTTIDSGETVYVLPHYIAQGSLISIAPGILTTRGGSTTGWSSGTEFNCEIAGVSRNYLQLNCNPSNVKYFVNTGFWGTQGSSALHANEALWSGLAIVWEA